MIQLNATILNEEKVTVILDKAKKNGLHTVMVLEESEFRIMLVFCSFLLGQCLFF